MKKCKCDRYCSMSLDFSGEGNCSIIKKKYENDDFVASAEVCTKQTCSLHILVIILQSGGYDL